MTRRWYNRRKTTAKHKSQSSFRRFHFFIHEGKLGMKCITGILSVTQVSCHTNHSFISQFIFILNFHLLCRRLWWMIYYLLHVNCRGKYCHLSITAEDHTNDKLNSICFNYRNTVAILTFALCTAAVSSVPLNILKSKIIYWLNMRTKQGMSCNYPTTLHRLYGFLQS